MSIPDIAGGAEQIGVPAASYRRENIVWREGKAATSARVIAEETAVALTYDGSTQAVMMASPQDLEDFAVGFSLTERIIGLPDDIRSLDVVAFAEGVELRMWLTKPLGDALASRRRQIVGPTGCGLCGVDSLVEAVRPTARVANTLKADPADISAALAALSAAQTLNAETRAVHAAGLWRRSGGLVAMREDVGRHNALDKLVGALARRRESSSGGMLILTSRVSIEMVQKAAVLGTEILVAVSAPTALALRTAEAAGITVVAVARADGFEIFTHPHRVAMS
jgi:FdhD protein